MLLSLMFAQILRHKQARGHVNSLSSLSSQLKAQNLSHVLTAVLFFS